jgi:hypothetical protein
LREAVAAGILAGMKPEIDPKLLNDPVFKRVLEDSLAIQDRFSAEPVYARTGKGSLKSEGVKPLQKIKSARKSREG